MLISEIKAVQIKVGDTFNMSDDLGNFKRGEEVTVDSVELSGMDFVVTLSNNNGVTDTFYLDRDDEI